MERTLWTLINDFSIGATMTMGALKIGETTYKLGKLVGSEIQDYVGTLGSGMVEYGMPGIYAAAAVSFIYNTVKAADRLQLSE